jgi:hypothetical protein
MNEFGYDADAPEGDAYEFLTFEERDEVDALNAASFRETVYGLPARPGTKR